MPNEDHPTRRALLDAGLALAERDGLATITVDQIVAEAAVAKGTFYVHFQDREAYLVALHSAFHDQLRAAIVHASAGLPPGRDRLLASTRAYLDGCLRSKGVKGMLIQARGVPEIAESVMASNDRFARASRPDFEALGVQYVLETAHLYVAATAEVAVLEATRGRRNPRLRGALAQLLEPRS